MSRFARKQRPGSSANHRENIKNLFEIIRDEKMLVEHLANNWVVMYRDNEAEAYLVILNFLLESMGIDKNVITAHDLESEDMEGLLAKISKKSKDPEEYPVVCKTKQFKTFYINFQHFWIYLVTEAGDTLYDEVLLTFLTNWLTSLSFNAIKSIRHTSTLAILSIGQALIDLLTKENSDLVRVQTFIRTELNNSDTQRLHHLQTQEQEIKAKQKILEKELESIFSEVLQHRCIDVLIEIRAISIQALHYMAEKMPEKFLNPDVLGILSICLFDKSSDVRIKTLEFFSSLLHEDNQEKLKFFLKDNKLRILEMCHDIDNKVAVMAINICTNLAKFMHLSKEDIKIVACLVWAEAEDIRNAGCNFLLQAVFKDKLPLDPDTNVSLSIDQGRPLDWEKAIMRLVSFHKEYKETEMCRIEIIVKTLWNKTSVVKSWEVMCELLKRGQRSNTTPLSDMDKKILIYMLISGLKFIFSVNDKKQKHTMAALTSTLLSQLPGLLVYYSRDPETLQELVKIPLYLDLAVLSAKDLQQSFFTLTKILLELQSRANEVKIIFKVTQCLAKMAREPHSLQKEAKSEVLKLVGEVCLGLSESLKKFILEWEEEGLENWLIRAESLISVIDIIEDFKKDTTEDLMGILSRYLSNGMSNAEITKHAVGILFFYQLWDLNRISKHPEGLEKYLSTRSLILENFTALIAKPDCNGDLKYTTFKYLCETLMVVSSQAAFGSPLHFEVNKDIWTTIEEYILTSSVFLIRPNLPIPSGAFYKFGAKDEQQKEDADEISQTICLLVARIICFCPSITTSHLPSSFLAHFGPSSIKSISAIVKQVMIHYKTKESQQSGVFNDSALFFSIILEGLIKAMGSGSDEEISDMKDLAKKFASVMGAGAMRPKQADKFLAFVIDGISFAFSDKDNFQILEGLNIFLQRNYLSPNQIKELYDRVSKDADLIEEKIKQHHEGDIQSILYPIKHFLYSVGKIVGISRQPPVPPSEKTKKQINKRREELYSQKEKDQEKTEKNAKTVGIKKSAVNAAEEISKAMKEEAVENEEKGLEENLGEVELPAKRGKRDKDEVAKPVKKSSILVNENYPKEMAVSKSAISTDRMKPIIKKSSIMFPDSPKSSSKNSDSEAFSSVSNDSFSRVAQKGRIVKKY